MAEQPHVRWLTRLGLALVAPRWALAVADEPRLSGRAGNDLLVALIGLLLGAHLRRLVAAGWLGVAVDVGTGLRGAASAMAQALTTVLAFVVVASLLVYLAAGKQRALGRAFDLVSVAALPVLVVELISTVTLRVFELPAPTWLPPTVTALAFAWAGVLLGFAVARARQQIVADTAGNLPARLVRRGRIVGIAVVAVVLLGIVAEARWIAGNRELLRPMRQGDTAPTLALPGIDDRGELAAVTSLTDFAGQVVVLEFWATWCGPCLRSLPGLAQLQRTHAAAGLHVVTINLDDRAKARRMFTERHLTLGLLADDGDTATRFGVSGIPHLVVIGRDGRVRAVHRGGAAHAVLDAEITAALAQP